MHGVGWDEEDGRRKHWGFVAHCSRGVRWAGCGERRPRTPHTPLPTLSPLPEPHGMRGLIWKTIDILSCAHFASTYTRHTVPLREAGSMLLCEGLASRTTEDISQEMAFSLSSCTRASSETIDFLYPATYESLTAPAQKAWPTFRCLCPAGL